MDLDEMSRQENCTAPDQIERKKKRKRDASDKGEVNRSEFSEGIPLVVDSGEAPTADSVSLMHGDGPLLNGSKKKRKDKKKKKGKKKQEIEATNLSNSTMSADGPSFVSRDLEGSSEPVNESNIPLSKGKKRKKKKEKQETAVTNPNNTNVPAAGPNSVLQELNENTGPVCKSKKKKKKKEKKQEEEAIEQHNSNKSAGVDSTLLELNEKTDVTNGRLNKEKKKKKKKKKQRHEVVSPNDSCASVEGPGPLLPELNVKTELMGESKNSVGKKRRKKRQKTEDSGSGYISAHDEALTSGHQNGVLEGTTVCLEKDQELGSPVQAAPPITSVEAPTICLEEKAGLTDCLENTKLRDQCESHITAVVSIGNTSTPEIQEHKNNEVLQTAKQNTCQVLVECLATTICNHEAEHPEHKIANEDTDIKDIDLPASEGMVSEDVKVETIKVDEPRPILSRFIDANDTQSSRKKLLILDLNGLLVDVIPYYSGRRKPDMVLSRKYVFRRPFVDDFLKFCFKRFAVAIWSSRTRRNIDPLIKFLFGNSRKKLVFRWNQSQCTRTKFMTLENKDKPLVLKELRKVWKKLEPDLPFEKGEYNELNTLLLDDSPYKALRNPANTAVFPYSYRYDMEEDNSLGPGGDLRVYLENLASAENIPEYVKQNPFGQSAITTSDPSWHFYEEVLNEEQRRKRPRHSRWDC